MKQSAKLTAQVRAPKKRVSLKAGPILWEEMMHNQITNNLSNYTSGSRDQLLERASSGCPLILTKD
jgi:hypothetical protein